MREVVGFEGAVEFDPTKPDGTPRKLLDVSRIQSLGWTPRIDLVEGIRQTYEWYSRRQFAHMALAEGQQLAGYGCR